MVEEFLEDLGAGVHVLHELLEFQVEENEVHTVEVPSTEVQKLGLLQLLVEIVEIGLGPRGVR